MSPKLLKRSSACLSHRYLIDESLLGADFLSQHLKLKKIELEFTDSFSSYCISLPPEGSFTPGELVHITSRCS